MLLSGTSAFYHVIRDCHGISTKTVHRAVHSVCNALFDFREEFIHWPENPQTLAREFFKVFKFLLLRPNLL